MARVQLRPKLDAPETGHSQRRPDPRFPKVPGASRKHCWVPGMRYRREGPGLPRVVSFRGFGRRWHQPCCEAVIAPQLNPPACAPR